MILAHAARARAQLGLGEASVAAKHARLAFDLLEKTGDREHAVSVYVALALTLDALGEKAEAKAAVQKARDAVQAAADLLSDPEMRRVFTENVADHARALALAREWPGS